MCDTFQSDNPIVYCSEAFTHLTGYNERGVLGRNFRFLQTSLASLGRYINRLSHNGVDDIVEPSHKSEMLRLRSALARSEEVQVTVRNYTISGTAFANLVTIVLVRWQSDSEGNTIYGRLSGMSTDSLMCHHTIRLH